MMLFLYCHKPIKFGHLVGNKFYFTIILTFIPVEGKSKSYMLQSHYLLNSPRIELTAERLPNDLRLRGIFNTR